tara:strand:+ start:94 stop:543 length:450 start_codon:yes stop_codon:yes gene_type:complete
MNNKKKLKVIKGGLSLDNRGSLIYCNELDLSQFKRFYIVSNFNKNFIRAWHGHKKESKYAIVIEGTVMFCVVKVDDWRSPSKKNKVEKFILSSQQPRALDIPCGYSHGFMTLTDNAKIIFFSYKTLNESIKDDFRLPYSYWDVWKIEQR